MENSNKALFLGAGVILTCLVVTIGFGLLKSARVQYNNALGNYTDSVVGLDQAELLNYNHKEFSGNQIISLAKDYPDLRVVIKNGYGEFDFKDRSVTTKKPFELTKNEKKLYFEEEAVYVASLLKKNDEIIGIIFSVKV